MKNSSEVIGRFPFVIEHRAGFRILRMPAFTHILGPIVDPGNGKHLTRLSHHISILRQLIDQLPRVDFFKQACGSSIADGLAFQECGFSVKPQYNFQIDCRKDLDILWNDMSSKVRGHIRRAERDYNVSTIADPEQFVWFYLKNMKSLNRRDRMDFETFPDLFSQVTSRRSGEILMASAKDGTPLAMVFLVWGQGYMYYTLSTRSPDISATGATNLLIWSAIKRAHEAKLVFDLDGVINSGTARFYLGYGGQLTTRLIVTRERPLYRAARVFVKRALFGGDDELSRFT